MAPWTHPGPMLPIILAKAGTAGVPTTVVVAAAAVAGLAALLLALRWLRRR